MPATAHACAMPLPIVPAPMTPTVRCLLMRCRLPLRDVGTRDYAAAGDGALVRTSGGTGDASAHVAARARRMRDEPGEERVDQRAARRARGRTRRVEHPLVHDAAACRRAAPARRARVSVSAGSCAAVDRAPQQAARRAAGSRSARDARRSAIGASSSVNSLLWKIDLEHRLRRADRVARRISAVDRRACAACRADRRRVARRQRASIASIGSVARSHMAREQVGLVAEMPVDGAARHARRGGDLGQRRARDALGRGTRASAASSSCSRVTAALRLVLRAIA